MEKTITLPDDKFERATKIDQLLSQGWSIRYDPTDNSLAIITKTDLKESTSGKPELLLG